MTIAETTIDGARKRAAQSALEMSGVHSDTGEAKENFDFSSHDKYYEDELRSKRLNDMGFYILRFTNNDVLNNTNETILTIQKKLQTI